MARSSLFPGLVAVARAVVYCCSAFWLFGFVETQQITGFQLFPFLALGILSYLILRFFLRQPRPLPALAALALCLTVGSCTLLLRNFFIAAGPLSLCLGVVFVGAVVLRAIQICTHPITAAQSISALERCTGFFIVFLWFQGSAGLPSGYSVPLMAASLLSLVAVLYQRLAAGSEQDTSRKWIRGLIVVTAVLLLIVAALYLFFAFGAGPMTQAILALYNGIKYLLSVIWQAFCAFLAWLSSFVKDPGPQELPEAMPSFTPEELPESVLPDGRVYAVIAVIGILALLAAALWGLYRLRSLRIRGHMETAKKNRVIRHRIPLLRWLQRLWERVTAYFRLRITVLAMRGTPQELYYFLTRAGRRLGLGKIPGETPGAFIRRLGALPSTQADPALSEALSALESALYQALYTPERTAALPPHHAHCIRRRLRRALWRARWAGIKQFPARLRERNASKKPKKAPPQPVRAQKNT